MSISATMSSALSGLTVASRGAEVVSQNIANAMTDGYARRELQVTARNLGTTGQGAQVSGILRNVDRAVLGERRLADAGAADTGARAAFLATVERALGTPENPRSMIARIGAFNAALLAAASRPDSEARLNTVAETAKDLTSAFAEASGAIQDARSAADAAIARDVTQLGQTLAEVADLNGRIRATIAAGRDSSALMDQRQQVIDRITAIVPVRELDRGMGVVALYTDGGAMLLDGTRPAEIGFSPAGMVTADMTAGSGALSGLTLNGRPVAFQPSGQLSGGSLSAQMAIRDDLGPGAQARLDALARDLVERFADPALDATRAPGAAGLFTDRGAPFDPANEAGLASRLRLNAAADPAQGGQLFRLRDGLGAATPGPTGRADLLVAYDAALMRQRQPVSGGFMTGERSFSVLAGQVVSIAAEARLSAESRATQGAAQAEALRTMELENGIDTDHELQLLLAIERSYGANARVIQAVDQMLQTLIGI